MSSNLKKGFAGKRGDKVRSDCFVEIIPQKSGGLKIEIASKVKPMFGLSIKKQITEMCAFLNLKNVQVIIEDNGALPFVIAARFEAAVKRLNPAEEKEFLLPIIKTNTKKTSKDKLRRSRLYLPGNEPKFFPNAGLHKPDGIILDLEDSVPHSEKDSARFIVRNALRSLNFYGCERMVRINQFPQGLDDLKYLIPHNVNVILIPKCETGEQVVETVLEIKRLKAENNIKTEIHVMPIIESAKGIINAYEIACASPEVCALTIGLEDYTADIGTQRTFEGKESLFGRSMIVNAAKAAGVQAIDSVFSDINDMDALRQSVIEAKSLGFEGKGCIHPRQIQVVHEAFAPEYDEIEKAQKIVLAFEEAERKGLGVVSLGSKMIDAPVVKRAHKTIELALLNKKITKNWKNEINKK
ncbi:MAG TPA: aldolase/citrate lyase family protein [Ignavibacteriaceae bacterium]|nr:aldolase/citrate lyase family protein [Ignavibacteriaceae bacterium]